MLFAARFPGRTIQHEGHGHGEGDTPFPIIEYVGADAVLQGVEAHADVRVLHPLLFELGLDYVRGALAATDEPLPRIPPLRLRGGVRYQRDALQFGAEMIGTADQGRVFGAETPTAGAALLKLHAAWSFVTGSVTNTITARVDNATNELYRSHLSLIKALVPERGRDVRVVYDVSF